LVKTEIGNASDIKLLVEMNVKSLVYDESQVEVGLFQVINLL
jgi:hypothetical protein